MNYINSGGQASLSDYYTLHKEGIIFNEDLRKRMVFSVHNLVCDQSFNEFELIMCRNVMIYFNKDLQNVALNLYSESQNNLGFLALGPNESILFLDANRKYKFHDAKHNIFQLMGPNQ